MREERYSIAQSCLNYENSRRQPELNAADQETKTKSEMTRSQRERERGARGSAHMCMCVCVDGQNCWMNLLRDVYLTIEGGYTIMWNRYLNRQC